MIDINQQIMIDELEQLLGFARNGHVAKLTIASISDRGSLSVMFAGDGNAVDLLDDAKRLWNRLGEA